MLYILLIMVLNSAFLFACMTAGMLSLIACSHRRHGQDKTVLSCLLRVGSVDTVGDKTVANWKLGRDKTKLSCLVTSCVHTADTDKTRQFCLFWTQFPICNCLISNILRITENLEIGNLVETRQNCLVLSAVVFKTVLSCEL